MSLLKHPYQYVSPTSDICVHCLQHQTYVSIVYNIRHMCPLSTTSDICVHCLQHQTCVHCLQHQTYVSIVYNIRHMCPLSTTSDICVHCLQHQTYVSIVYNIRHVSIVYNIRHVSIVYNIRHMCPLSTTSDICVHISILATFSMSFGFHAPKDLLIIWLSIWLSNILTLSVPDEVDFRKVSYTLLYTVFMVFFVI